ncbi:MAG: carbamoyltransferase HypF, partial [Gemmatimonas sp.]
MAASAVQPGARRSAATPPDIATCGSCIAELFSPGSRRFGHPFITCTDCGPRFSVVLGVPYDRDRTSMRDFPLCAACHQEYLDPSDRRFHAESISCHACGPALVARDAREGDEVGRDAGALSLAAETIKGGGIVAVKALGGFQLACDASNEAAVAMLRRRKARPGKPLAVMVADASVATALCELGELELSALMSAARPIVILPRRTERPITTPITSAVAQGRATLGIMLPSTPVHYLLLALLDNRPLVMTSGNRAGEPVLTDDDEALRSLGDVADVFLSHDRRIAARCDDSVVRVVAGAPTVVRRARGFTPSLIALPINVSVPVLAVGGHLKNTVCIAHAHAAHLSAHIGDLDSLAATVALRHAVEATSRISGVRPLVVAHDLHPEYASTRFAESFAEEHGIQRRVPIQHHHAHVAACVAEHALEEPVIGVAFDGTGLGTDGAIWGGEFLVVNGASFTRHGHLAYVALPGGDAAARRPWRSAAAHLAHAGVDAGWLADMLPIAARNDEWPLVQQMIARDTFSHRTSSIGRLFDAVASMTGICHESRFEGEAAIALEEAAAGGIQSRYEMKLRDGQPWTADPATLIDGVMSDLRQGREQSQVAAGFQGALRDLVVLGCERVRDETGLATVTLSGG